MAAYNYNPYRLGDRVETVLVAVSVFVGERLLITNLYIDGFNLYYRALRGTPFKWLDLQQLAENLFPEDTINSICYFTALLEARPHDSHPAAAATGLSAGLEDAAWCPALLRSLQVQEQAPPAR